MTDKFRFWALMVFVWTLDHRHKVYFFERSKKIYNKSSPKTLKLVDILCGSEKEAKNSNGSFSLKYRRSRFWNPNSVFGLCGPISLF
jgi:hypothetical protein